MNKYKEYIGKTFKGFKFSNEEYPLIGYYPYMNDAIGKDLEIRQYRENSNCFFTNQNYFYPADLVIAKLEKQETFKPEGGDKVLVWDNEEKNAIERIFLCEIEGAELPYICVTKTSEDNFINGDIFNINAWTNIKPIQKTEITKL